MGFSVDELGWTVVTAAHCLPVPPNLQWEDIGPNGRGWQVQVDSWDNKRHMSMSVDYFIPTEDIAILRSVDSDVDNPPLAEDGARVDLRLRDLKADIAIPTHLGTVVRSTADMPRTCLLVRCNAQVEGGTSGAPVFDEARHLVVGVLSMGGALLDAVDYAEVVADITFIRLALAVPPVAARCLDPRR